MAIDGILLGRGVISKDDLDRARAEQRASGERIDRVITRLGLAPRETILAAIGEQLHLPVVDLSSLSVDPSVLSLLPSRLVFKQHCVPISRTGAGASGRGGTLTIATSNPYDLSVVDELRLITGCSIELALADEQELHKFIRANYGVGGDTLDAMAAEAKPLAATEKPGDDEMAQAQEASVVRLVNDILTEAVAERATDVHIEPYEQELIVRYRIDGVLQRANVPATINRFASAVVSRLKIMANLNIAEKRKPQDGRITFKTRPAPGRPAEEFDLRVSVIPMLFGEGVVLRVLSKTAVLLPLQELGMPEWILARWRQLIDRPHGILLVTGPTGSGKSTTLYASLNRIVTDEIKVITVEDPVEYHVAGVNQIQVNHKVGLDFAAGLRSILRHDPDVVMIGEIRDKETAETAVQASLTGHLVFSTLHTNDAAGATTRLLDMGVEPFLVSSSVEGVLAQRLVRRICRECRESYEPHAGDLPDDFVLAPTDRAEGEQAAGEQAAGAQVAGVGAGVLYRGKGCRNCRNTGYRGRLGIYELLSMTDALREMIMHRGSAHAIAAHASRSGDLRRMREDGYAKALAGSTTMHEVTQALAG
ncbi:MAG: GspE/PulE family protein [Planctomycetota bacterium]|nr:GspE/PulE family protein [Planctomycetota bacterium]